MNKTILILDTSSIINHPNIFQLLDNTLFVIPIEVLEELDNLKVKNDDAGFGARRANRIIDELRDGGSLTEGVSFGSGNSIRVFMGSDLSLVPAFYSQNTDSKIISVAKYFAKDNQYVRLVSSDIALRIKASAIGIDSLSDDEILFGKEDLIYSGCKTINVGQDIIADFYRDGSVGHIRNDLHQNQAIVLQTDESSGALGIVKGEKIVKLRDGKKESAVMGMSPKNKEQRFAFDYILDQNIPLVSMVGPAGSGKTLIAVVLAMYLLDKGVYEKLVICRPAVSASAGIGFLPGPQPLSAKILTPSGWSTMGEMNIGSKIMAHDGTQTTVLDTFPKGKKAIYKITTTDGTSTECCEDHLWKTQTWENKKRGKEGVVKTTREIINTIKTKSGRLNHYLPRNSAMQFDAIELPLEPYTLGALLGDGSISNHITLFNTDSDIIARVENEVKKYGCRLHSSNEIGYNIASDPWNKKTARQVKFTNMITSEETIFESVGIAFESIKNTVNIAKSTLQNRCQRKRTIDNVRYEYLGVKNRWQNNIKEILFKLGLHKMHALTKFIPECYKFNSSVSDRISLLQGLMDTDGTIKKNGEASFCTISRKLAEDITDIVRSLGGRSVIRQRDRTGDVNSNINGRQIKTNHILYEFNISLPKEINPFSCKRKAERHRCSYIYDQRIASIEPVGEKEAKCILIDTKDHLYITDEFIVTHNTKEEKLQPWIQPIFDNLKHMMKYTDTYLELLMSKGKIEVESLSYIRGRTFPNTVMIVDEAQNATTSEMKAVITRMGSNSKIIITGDLEQIDSPKLDMYSSGLSTVVNNFKHSELAAHITMIKTERSEIAALASKLL